MGLTKYLLVLFVIKVQKGTCFSGEEKIHQTTTCQCSLLGNLRFIQEYGFSYKHGGEHLPVPPPSKHTEHSMILSSDPQQSTGSTQGPTPGAGGRGSGM